MRLMDELDFFPPVIPVEELALFVRSSQVIRPDCVGVAVAALM